MPRFIKTCRTLDEFWQFIKTKIEGNGSYAKRRTFLKEAFEPLLSYLEELELSSDSTIELSSIKQVQTLDEELNLLIEEVKRRVFLKVENLLISFDKKNFTEYKRIIDNFKL